MKFFEKLQKKIELSSLRMRLTVAVAVVSALGLGSVTIWTSLRMQQILIVTNKQNIQYISDSLSSRCKNLLSDDRTTIRNTKSSR